MNRENQRTVITKQDVALHLGHKVTFNYEIATGQERPTGVIAMAVKVDDEGAILPNTGGISVNVSANNINTNYQPNTPWQLVADIRNECLLLINGEGDAA